MDDVLDLAVQGVAEGIQGFGADGHAFFDAVEGVGGKALLVNQVVLGQTFLEKGMYRWHITDPIYFKDDLKVTIQALGWRKDGRYLPLKDDISSVAFWYQDSVCKDFPALPDFDDMEII